MVKWVMSTSVALLLAFSFEFWIQLTLANPDAKRLYDDLLSKYNKIVRPVLNNSDPVIVHVKLKLSQLIEVDLKNQIMTTNLWVEQYWNDPKLLWTPDEYGGIDNIYVPSDHIWRPDIVLYNNADGNFEVTLATKAKLYANGLVEWNPPAIYKSSCEMDVEFFPYDEQTCFLKFGSWTYDGYLVDLRHPGAVKNSTIVDNGVDLSEFYVSGEWDILEIPAERNERYYPCCDEPYLDITFNITLCRKTLFYTVNLMLPFTGISFLSVIVFYLPSSSGEKVTLSISILFSLTVFFLLLAEIVPSTSLVVPLLGKCVLFTMMLNTLNICGTVIVLNVHFRSEFTHKITPWERQVFLHSLPNLLRMRRPQYDLGREQRGETSIPYNNRENGGNSGTNGGDIPSPMPPPSPPPTTPTTDSSSTTSESTTAATNTRKSGSSSSTGENDVIVQRNLATLLNGNSDLALKVIGHINFIAEHAKSKEEKIKVKEDWKYIALVLDKLLLWVLSLSMIIGTIGIIFQAPSLYGNRVRKVTINSALGGVSKPPFFIPPAAASPN